MIEINKLDPEFKYVVASHKDGEHIMRCYACGTCTVSCPIRDTDERFNPRRIIRMVLLGMKKEVLTSDFVWFCSGCHTCLERCPQGVKITELMTILKNIAVKEGYIHPGFKAQAELVYKLGRLYEVEDFDNKRREKSGLPKIKKVFEEVKEIYKLTGLERIISK